VVLGDVEDQGFDRKDAQHHELPPQRRVGSAAAARRERSQDRDKCIEGDFDSQGP